MCPTPGSYKLILSTSLDKTGITQTFTNVDPELGDNSQFPQQWQTAIVEQGIWILYDNKNYNDDQPDKGKIQIVYPGETKLVNFQPQSLRPLTSSANSISLFEHKNYGGKMKIYTSNQAYLPDFPASVEAGVSSVYITDSRDWRLYLAPNYLAAGGSFVLSPKRSNFYKDLAEYNKQDERVQSIKFAWTYSYSSCEDFISDSYNIVLLCRMLYNFYPKNEVVLNYTLDLCTFNDLINGL